MDDLLLQVLLGGISVMIGNFLFPIINPRKYFFADAAERTYFQLVMLAVVSFIIWMN